MGGRRAGVAVVAAVALVATMPAAAASRECDEGMVNPSEVTRPLEEVVEATGLQELHGPLNSAAGFLRKADGAVPLHAICSALP